MTADTPIDHSRTGQPIDDLTIGTIRTLSIDAVQAANSGHPGTPMALAPVAYTLWQHCLRFDPDLPVWRTATASCCRSGTRRRCCIPCCI